MVRSVSLEENVLDFYREYVKSLRSTTIHVGVNVSNTRPFLMVLPVFEDYSFVFIPIPSKGEGVTYRQLRDSLPGVCEVLEQLGFSVDIEVHNDPEFIDFTFGEGPRDWMLAKLRPGDYVFFVASMKKISVPSKTDFLKYPKKYGSELKGLLKRNRGPNWFYGMIAQIKISEIYAGKNVIKRYDLGDRFCELNDAVEDKLLTNAHVKRGGSPFWGLYYNKRRGKRIKGLRASSANKPWEHLLNRVSRHILQTHPKEK
jgi:hypothetical protein